MGERTTSCRYCGRIIHNAETGRPRLFCNDLHRKWYDKATADQMQAFLDAVAATRTVSEVRDLEHDLLALQASCKRVAQRLDATGDVVTHARIAAVACELGQTLARHFASQETRP
jgi:hypothetical protein